jgi:hypothetical protein
MLHHVGKFIEKIPAEKINLYSDAQLDMLWYIMDLTCVSRFVTPDTFKAFLIRFFLIRDKKTEDYALELLDDELLVDGFIGETYFSLSIGDLVNLIGFSSSNARYHVKGDIEEFFDFFKFKTPNVDFFQNEKGGKIQNVITEDALVYALMGLKHLLKLNHCSLKFRDNLKEISKENMKFAFDMADVIIKRLPPNVFSNYENMYPDVIKENKEFHKEKDMIRFDIQTDIDRDSLASIYDLIAPKEKANQFRKLGYDSDLMIDLSWHNEHIVFAYGIKHGLIQLSDDIYSLINNVDPLLDIDYEMIKGEDGEMYTTRQIYEYWDMEKWIDMLS